VLGPDGVYRRPPVSGDEARFDMQAHLMTSPERTGSWELDAIHASWMPLLRERPPWIDE